MSKQSSYVIVCLFLIQFLVGCGPAVGDFKNNQNSVSSEDSNFIYAPEAVPSACGSEDACACGFLMSEAAAGRNVNQADLNPRMGGSARDMFTHGGSMNIPVMCRSAHYATQGNPEWFTGYFDAQKEAAIGFMGREIGSPLYGPLVAGAVLLVKKEALRRGHAALADKAAEWLRAYWAFHSLTAVAGTNNNAHVIQQNGTVVAEPGRNTQSGVVVATAGTRRGKNEGMGSFSNAQQLMALAVDLPRRTNNVSESWGFSSGLRVALLVAGYPIGGNGSIGGYSDSRDSSIFGLLPQQRQDLRDFLTSNGQLKLNTILDMLRPYKPACHMTFLRTSEGASSWFGTNTEEQGICNRSKGPYFAAKVAPNGDSVYLAGTFKTNPSESGSSYRNGNRACARVDGYQPLCMDLPQGQRIYEIEWIKGIGWNVIYGNGGSGGGGNPPNPPAPTPAPPAPPTPPPSTSIPPAPAIGNCGNDVLCLHNGRYKVVATWHNQFNGQSGRAGVIPNTSYSGFLHFGDSTNFELMVKILDFNGSVKVFYGQLTNLRFYMYVKDTVTGVIKAYTNTSGDCGAIDQAAFGTTTIPNTTSDVSTTAFNCTPNSNTLCLQNGRIKITGTWRNQYNNSTGASGVRAYSQATGGMYYNDANNLELVVKALDFGDHFLIMYGAMSDLEYKINVTDQVTGVSKIYTNPAGKYCGGIDERTFTK